MVMSIYTLTDAIVENQKDVICDHFYYGTFLFHEWCFIPKWSVLGFHESG